MLPTVMLVQWLWIQMWSLVLLTLKDELPLLEWDARQNIECYKYAIVRHLVFKLAPEGVEPRLSNIIMAVEQHTATHGV